MEAVEAPALQVAAIMLLEGLVVSLASHRQRNHKVAHVLSSAREGPVKDTVDLPG